MDYLQAVEHTKNKKGMKQSMTGLCYKIANSRGAISGGLKFTVEELGKHFSQARNAWLTGDLETVAEFFGLYISK